MPSNIRRVLKSIKFRLAMLFSVILFVFAGSIIFLFNITIDNYLSTRAVAPASPPQEQTALRVEETAEQKVRSQYTDDLQTVRDRSIESLFPLALISFALGYYISGRFLKPLEELNTRIDTLKTDTLGSQIEQVPENEIGRTVTSFNEMSKRLQTAFDQQTRFVQDASHELRTPLTIVKTNLETVLDDDQATKADLKTAMTEALSGVDEVTSLANDLLALSRPQSSTRNVEDLNQVLQEIVASFKSLADQHDVHLELHSDERPVMVSINRSELYRALTNLIDNAIKYSKDAEHPHVSITITTSSEHALLQITDNGRGIPAADLDRIFNRFYRVNTARDRETGGFGLGLPIAQKIIIEHGGTVSVRSQPGETCFEVRLPLSKT